MYILMVIRETQMNFCHKMNMSRSDIYLKGEIWIGECTSPTSMQKQLCLPVKVAPFASETHHDAIQVLHVPSQTPEHSRKNMVICSIFKLLNSSCINKKYLNFGMDGHGMCLMS